MKWTLIIFCLLGSAFAQERESALTWKKELGESLESSTQELELKLRKETLAVLTEAKFSIINGNLLYAEKQLMELDQTLEMSGPIINRYLSLISFLRNNHTRSIELLRQNRRESNRQFTETCLFEALNIVMINRDMYADEKLRIKACLEETAKESESNHLWLRSILKYKEAPNSAESKRSIYKRLISKSGNDFATLRLGLKLGATLGGVSDLEKIIPLLPIESFYSNSIRELLGLIYFKTGNYEKAFSFVEDLDSANAQNIKGNIRLLGKDLESAYGNFTLAMRAKKNSRNALFRMIPLAWILGAFDDGLKFSHSPIMQEVPFAKRKALIAAFYLRRNEIEKAAKEIESLYRFKESDLPPSVSLISSYVSLIKNKKNELDEHAEINCKKFDAINCWIKIESLIWPDLGLVAKREDTIDLNASELIEKLTSSVVNEPIDEPLYVDQKDVEELDSSIVLRNIK